jgi:hypothetical protein
VIGHRGGSKGGKGKQRGLDSVKYVEVKNLLKLGISLDDKDFKSLSSNEIPNFSKFLTSTYFTESNPHCLPLRPLIGHRGGRSEGGVIGRQGWKE